MKKIIIGLTLLMSLTALAETEYFRGKGWCFIKSLPCKDGESIRCSAEGINGGFCIAEKSRGYYHLTCRANAHYAYGIPRRVVRLSCRAK